MRVSPHPLHATRWLIATRGILAVLFGLAALLWPNITLQVLILLVGAYVLADGIFTTAATTRYRGISDLWWIALLEGVCGIVAGIVALSWPALTALAFVVLIGIWSAVTGLIELVVARTMRLALGGVVTPLLPIGLLSLALGLYLLLFPHQGALLLTYLVGFYAFLSGVLLIQIAVRLHGIVASFTTTETTATTIP